MSHHIYLRILGYIITITLHVSNIFIMSNSFHGEPMKNKFVRQFNEMQYFFFTCWTFTFQITYAVIALYTDILTLKNSKSTGYELPKILVRCRDTFFSIFVWTSTITVCTIFWTTFHYDRSLFFPKDIDLVISKTSNHIMHTFILLPTLWEIIFRSREAPKSHMWHLLGVYMVTVVYFSVVFIVYEIKGIWVYPLFGILAGSIYFYFIFVFLLAYLPLIYYMQWVLNYAIWSSREKNRKLC